MHPTIEAYIIIVHNKKWRKIQMHPSRCPYWGNASALRDLWGVYSKQFVTYTALKKRTSLPSHYLHFTSFICFILQVAGLLRTFWFLHIDSKPSCRIHGKTCIPAHTPLYNTDDIILYPATPLLYISLYMLLYMLYYIISYWITFICAYYIEPFFSGPVWLHLPVWQRGTHREAGSPLLQTGEEEEDNCQQGV